jgi:hypothetical protein
MPEPDFDCHGYPTDYTLKTITEWTSKEWSHEDFAEFMAYVQQCWRYQPEYFEEREPGKWYVSTGGWSGNESIIGAMRRNFIFWSLHWVVHRRGGHFQFEARRL